MIPYDGFCNPLPPNPYTIMRGFASIDKHPDRTHEHISYKIRNMENPSDPPVNAAAINEEELKVYDDSNMEDPSAPPVKTAAIDEGELKVNHGILVSCFRGNESKNQYIGIIFSAADLISKSKC